MRGIVKVVTAVANGDLSQKFVVEAKGEIAALADTINDMTDTLRVFAEQVTTVAREVGIEGKLGGQAEVPGVSGTWRDLTDNVNMLAGNLTNQVRNIALVTTAVANGDLSQKITVEARGRDAGAEEHHQHAWSISCAPSPPRSPASPRRSAPRASWAAQADVKGVSGTWKDLTDNVNLLAGNLTNQVRNIALVTTAVANGDLSQKITVEAKGEILELKNTINTMVDQLRAFAAEVTRVAREVGTEGKLGGQAQVPGVAGTWKDLTDNVNFMASNLTNQVRGIVKVVTAVANGDLVAEVRRRGEGRDRRARRHHQRHDRHAAHLRRAGHHGRARGRHRGQAGRPGQGAGRRRHLARPHRQREHAGRQPDQPGAQHRGGHHRRRERRSLAEDHRRRQGRDPRAQEHHQRDGRAAAHLRRAR